jgi:site-specific DNA-methyltransferase (adenine-specific)
MNLVRQVQRVTQITTEALARKLGVPVEMVTAWSGGQAIPEQHAGPLRTFLAHAQERRPAGVPRKPTPSVESGVFAADGLEILRTLPDDSIDMILSDIPYGIGHDDWDVLHDNRNAAYLGQSAAQKKAGTVFKKRRKPINGWSSADREIPREYEAWCATWASEWCRVLKPGASAMIFAGRRLAHRCVCAMEDAGFNLRDMLAWERPQAVLRAQRLEAVFRKRGELAEAEHWSAWRVGNLRPVFEPILWFFKPYKHTIADNVLDFGLGAFNLEAYQRLTDSTDNIIRMGFRPGEAGLHEAQKPVDLLRALIELCCPADALVCDPFAGSGSTGVAAIESGRGYLLVERNADLVRLAKNRLSETANTR